MNTFARCIFRLYSANIVPIKPNKVVITAFIWVHSYGLFVHHPCYKKLTNLKIMHCHFFRCYNRIHWNWFHSYVWNWYGRHRRCGYGVCEWNRGSISHPLHIGSNQGDARKHPDLHPQYKPEQYRYTCTSKWRRNYQPCCGKLAGLWNNCYYHIHYRVRILKRYHYHRFLFL